MTLGISIFLSYPKPHLSRQESFVEKLTKYLSDRGLTARTLGVTDYSGDAPLVAIRRLMIESNGLIAIAFRRTYLTRAVTNAGSDTDGRPERTIESAWSTSIWAHVEPAMAHQLGLPVLLLREDGVLAEGMYEQGVLGLYSPTFNLDDDSSVFFGSAEWKQVVRQWEARVNRVAESKGQPPTLY